MTVAQVFLGHLIIRVSELQIAEMNLVKNIQNDVFLLQRTHMVNIGRPLYILKIVWSAKQKGRYFGNVILYLFTKYQKCSLLHEFLLLLQVKMCQTLWVLYHTTGVKVYKIEGKSFVARGTRHLDIACETLQFFDLEIVI